LLRQPGHAGRPGSAPADDIGPDLYELPDYRAIPFVLDAGGTPFAELLPGLPNPSSRSGRRPSVLPRAVRDGRNFSTMLWVKLFDELRSSWGIPLRRRIRTSLAWPQNVAASGKPGADRPPRAGDAQAIATNLRALEGDPFHACIPQFVRAYGQRS